MNLTPEQRELKPFDQTAFDKAMTIFHGHAPTMIISTGTLEYIAAALATLREGAGWPSGLSLMAIEHMTRKLHCSRKPATSATSRPEPCSWPMSKRTRSR